MRERRYVKFKVDIYDDTKTKIIDQKPERDFIHYFFARSIILAGKSDCEGKLYMAKDIPYTIETLATEFSRDAALVKLALDVLIELKMIEVTEDNIYRVKSFVKHQNIKVKEEDKANVKEEAGISENNKKRERKDAKPIVLANKEVSIKDDKQVEDSRSEKIKTPEECAYGNNQVKEENESHLSDAGQDTKFVPVDIKDEENIHANSELNTADDYLCNNQGQTQSISELDKAGNGLGDNHNWENVQSNSEENNLVVLEMKDNRKPKKKKNESNSVTELSADEIEEDSSPILFFSEGDMPPLGEGERLVWGMTPV